MIDQKKRVLMLASVASMIDQFNMPNIELLQSMGYDVDVACNFKEGNTCSKEVIHKLIKRLKAMNVGYFQIDFSREATNMSRHIKSYRQVYYFMKKNGYAFVHCHSPIGGVIGRLAGGLTHTKVIYTAHGFHFYKGAPLKNWLLYYPIEKFCSYVTDTLITINKEDYNFAKEKMHAKHVEYVPGVGVDIEKFSPKADAEQNRKSIREELGISDEEIFILSVGELNENKNHELIIRVIAQMHDTLIHYAIAGQGGKREYYENLINELGVNKQIHLLGYRSDIPQLDQSADVFAFPSLREGMGLAAIEALSAGTPVCGMNTRGTREYVINAKTGYLFDNNIESCEQALRRTIRRKDFMRRNCLEISNRYSCERVLSIMKSIYGEHTDKTRK